MFYHYSHVSNLHGAQAVIHLALCDTTTLLRQVRRGQQRQLKEKRTANLISFFLRSSVLMLEGGRDYVTWKLHHRMYDASTIKSILQTLSLLLQKRIATSISTTR